MYRPLLVAFVLSVSSNGLPFVWEALESAEDFPGVGRRYAGLTYVAGRLCVFGGEGQNGTALGESEFFFATPPNEIVLCAGDLFCYSDSSRMWSTGLSEGPALYGFVHGYVTGRSRWYVTHGEYI